MSYINSTLHYRMTGWVGDESDKIALHLFADADFAGCAKTSRSTSGAYMCIMGPNTHWPVAGQSKKQGCTSHTTPESEIIAADHALRSFGIPALDLWSPLLNNPNIHTHFHADHETAIIAMRQGHSNTMRHLERTHGVSLRSLAEHVNKPHCVLDYERSALQSGDIFTKGFTALPDWLRATKLINHYDPTLFWEGRTRKMVSAMPNTHKGGRI